MRGIPLPQPSDRRHLRVWSSARNVVTGSLPSAARRMPAGARLVGFRPRPTAIDALASRYDLSRKVSDLDLSLWVPALGFQRCRSPATPRAARFAAASRGRSARQRADRSGRRPADARKGDRLRCTPRGARRVDRAELATPGLSATAAGSPGCSAQPLDLQRARGDGRPSAAGPSVRPREHPGHGSFESTCRSRGTCVADVRCRARRGDVARVRHPYRVALRRSAPARAHARSFKCRGDVRDRDKRRWPARCRSNSRRFALVQWISR